MLVILTLVKVTYRNRVGMSKFETGQDIKKIASENNVRGYFCEDFQSNGSTRQGINTHAQATEPIDYCDEKIS